MLKKAAIMLFAALLFVASQVPAQAATTDRWQYLRQTEGWDVYYDNQTATYNDQAKTMTFWLGFKSNGKFDFMRQIQVNLVNRTYHDLLRTEIGSTGFAQTKRVNNHYESNITPGNFVEKACDQLCDRFHIERLSAANGARWKWLTSTDKYTVNYATDRVEIDTMHKTVVIWVQKTYLDGHKNDAEKYICDLNNQTVEYYGSKGYFKEIVSPDSFLEIVWNKAQSLYNNQE